VAAGDIIEIYATGLGAVLISPSGLRETTVKPQVTIAGSPADVLFSGVAPGFEGLYQVNVRMPAVPTGSQTLKLSISGVASNEVKVLAR
jgi:uncharacterized protein (TIGR03437 family)